ncbi:MAG: molybdopterin dinucleotide binding domain-containing protein, partial [Methanomicrobiaceae archaeon]|nr:molybdopterin dinucleotide binding domain-containing protein [Methanomicrobiaceae archaeon]
MRAIMTSGRTVTQGRHVESKGGVTYSEETSSCHANPVDLLELGIESGECVEVKSDHGSVVLRTIACEEVPRGLIFVPYGPFANHITGTRTHSSGMPDFKHVAVEITPTAE